MLFSKFTDVNFIVCHSALQGLNMEFHARMHILSAASIQSVNIYTRQFFLHNQICQMDYSGPQKKTEVTCNLPMPRLSCRHGVFSLLCSMRPTYCMCPNWRRQVIQPNFNGSNIFGTGVIRVNECLS